MLLSRRLQLTLFGATGPAAQVVLHAFYFKGIALCVLQLLE